MKTGIELIAEERQRQIEVEGWTPEHDDKHTCGELTDAAICYASTGYWRRRAPLLWPKNWEVKWWKPTPNDRIRELQKAGALIAAEIDRLNRIKAIELKDNDVGLTCDCQDVLKGLCSMSCPIHNTLPTKDE